MTHSSIFDNFQEKSMLQEALSVEKLEALTTMEPEQRIAVMRFLKEAQEKDLLRDSNDEETLWNLLNEKFEFDSRFVNACILN